MGAGATSARALLDAEGRWPEIIDKPTAEKLVAQTPGIAWDDDKWREVANEDRAARADIIALLDRLRVGDDGEAKDDDDLGDLPVYDGGDDEECFAKDGSGLEESFGPDCPGTFSVDADEGDDLPGMEFADGTGGLSLVGKPIAGGSPGKPHKPAAAATAGKKRNISVVEEVIAADGTAFDQLNPNAPGTFDEDAELGGATPRGDGEKRPHIDLGISGHAISP
ncbi:hypothetical protein SO694_00061120 [Aureococcus anophagefferens]|uniref:Uncharacterized protein n=2 Tax=Aureococcus anophagefferens TaxID=44056 RepID=F0YBK1_AURAN|nr:hypothetical protein AURANDRAFT_64809 [Aureococcus anophagefferens]EGB07684.1 hypothetical protein AURANDRAFT_64809 [Aureococcus anophagefferens]KAH8055882.1 hypothetical protein JL722_7698 [Aureococcus anophagefferens]|eukprot:XP_009037676.1 hypothetical protein AURANDRAFT_64809 [Aureococcus anophagefferens]